MNRTNPVPTLIAAIAFMMALLVFKHANAHTASPSPHPTPTPMQTPAPACSLPAFSTDLCTHYPEWSGYTDCCVIHDFDYFIGGTKRERASADWALGKCVREQGYAWRGHTMALGVRLAKLLSNWGWAEHWGDNRHKWDELDAADKNCARLRLDETDEMDPWMKEELIKRRKL